jgi:hypothetical protein
MTEETELRALGAVERQDGNRPIAIAYAVSLEQEKSALRNLRIPATGLSMFAGLQIMSKLAGAEAIQAPTFWGNFLLFFIAWAMNPSEATIASLIRQSLFIIPRITTLCYEVRLSTLAGNDAVYSKNRWLHLTVIIVAMLANVINIAFIIKAKVIDRARSQERYEEWTLVSHWAFSLHAILTYAIAFLNPETSKKTDNMVRYPCCGCNIVTYISVHHLSTCKCQQSPGRSD